MKFDEIGYWSEIKLEIIKKYAAAYSIIFNADKQRYLHHIYIDAFSGSGLHISKKSGDFVLGSPLNALEVEPPFRDYHFIDLNSKKVTLLMRNTTGAIIYYLFFASQKPKAKLIVEDIFKKYRQRGAR